jgi:hypothetical protein
MIGDWGLIEDCRRQEEARMPDRRSVIGAGLAAGIGAAAGASPEAAPQQAQERSLAEIAAMLGQIRRELQTSREQTSPGFGIVETIRQHQRTFLKATQKYPDYIDVGIRAWEAIADWHARFGLQWSVTRQPDGRYVTNFNLTTIILRPEQAEEYVSLPYDSK